MCPVSCLAQTKLKMILDWNYSGPQAVFFLAAERGYFKEEGIELAIDQGRGSGAAVMEVAKGAYQVGFGDLNTVVQVAAAKPAEAPVGVYMFYSSPPFSIATKKGSGITSPKSLEGRSLAAPAGSATLKLFAIVAAKENVDASKISITNVASNLMVQLLQRGQVDAVAGFATSLAMSAKSIGIDPDKDLNFIMYSDYGVELYGNALVVSRELVRSNPSAVRGLVRAVNRAMGETIRDPEAAIDALMKRESLLKRDIERETLVRTIRNEMSHPERRDIGFGDVREDRIQRAIVQMRDPFDLARLPEPNQVFVRDFLPPKTDRDFPLQ